MLSITGESARRPDITVYPNGRIDIASNIVKVLSLSPGDIVDIGRTASGEVCLYVRLKTPPGGVRFRARCFPVIRNRVYGSYRAWSKRIYSVMKAVADSDGTLHFACGEPFSVRERLLVPIIVNRLL